jgi:ATP-dependent Lon protease
MHAGYNDQQGARLDIDQPDTETTSSSQSKLVRARDVLPGTIPILPQAKRPFFPGQAILLLVEPSAWAETITSVQENANNIIGLMPAVLGTSVCAYMEFP